MRFSKTLFLLSLLLPVSLFAAEDDSLRELLKEDMPDTQRVNILNKLSYVLRGKSSKEAADFATVAINLARKNNYPRGEGAGYLHLGFAQRNMGMNKDAVKSFETSYKIAKENGLLKPQALALTALGNIHNNMSSYYTALEYHKKAYEIRAQLKDSAGMAMSMSNIGNMLQKVGREKEAMENLIYAVRILRKSGDPEDLAVTLNVLAHLYIKKKEYTKALDAYLQAYKIFESEGDNWSLAIVTINIGNCHYFMKDFNKAEEFYMKSMEMSEKNQDARSVAKSMLNLGAVKLEKNQLEESKNYLEKAITIFRDNDDKNGESQSMSALGVTLIRLGQEQKGIEEMEKSLRISRAINDQEIIMEVYKQLYEHFDSTARPGKALSYYKSLTMLRDSLRENEDKVRIEELEAMFNLKEQENKIDDLSREKQLGEEKLKTQRILLYTFLIAAVIFMVLLAMIFVNFRKLRRITTELRATYGLLREKSKNISDSIQYAKRIQDSMMITDQEVKEILPESFVLLMPRDVVSGDFYWITRITIGTGQYAGEEVTAVAAVDCTGHGVPGALMSMMGNTLLNQTLKEDVKGPGDALTYLHRQLPVMMKTHGQSGSVKDGMDMVLVAIDQKRNEVMVSGANNSLVIVSNGQLEEVKGEKMAIGGPDPNHRFVTNLITVKKGDMLYLFTDGYADQFGGPKGKKMNYTRFKKLLVEIASLPASQQKNELKHQFIQWKGNEEQVDDVLVIGVRV